ncbi:hypothetical protein [Actinocrispum sp. NPDC049592]|uniref:hypothetical protein n=1 Tax=Actinocrispum sp. NPDC049592 TaxID=3154835 RepID=UPI00341D564C
MKQPCDLPHHRSIIALDIADSTSRADTVKAKLRELMYEMVEKALQDAGIAPWHHDNLIDRGDGVLVLVHPVPQAPKALLLAKVIPVLAGALRMHNLQAPDQRLRLRTAMHAGEVNYDGHGCFGEALDITFRLLDAPLVKRILREVAESMVLVISDHVYRSVVRHGYQGVLDVYTRRTTVLVAGHHHRGWIASVE